MLDDSTNKFAIILRNEDLQNYAGDAFYNLVKAVTIHDTGAAVDGIKDSIFKIGINCPAALYFYNSWDYSFLASSGLVVIKP